MADRKCEGELPEQADPAAVPMAASRPSLLPAHSGSAPIIQRKMADRLRRKRLDEAPAKSASAEPAPGAQASDPHSEWHSQAGGLRRALGEFRINAEGGRGMHLDLKRLREEQNIVGRTSELAADAEEGLSSMWRSLTGQPQVEHADRWVEMPPLEIWQPVFALVQEALALIPQLEQNGPASGVLQTIQNKIAQARAQYQVCHRRVIEYRERVIGGAEISVAGLEGVVAACVLIESICTAGVASAAGAGLVGVSGAAAAGAGGGTLVLGGAQRGAEMHEGLRKDFGAGELLLDATTAAATTFLGAFVGGKLAGKFFAILGPRLAQALPLEAAERLVAQLATDGVPAGAKSAQLLGHLLTTSGQRFLINFFSGLGTMPLTIAITAALQRARGGPPMSMQQFIHLVVHETIKGGVKQLFIGAIMHGHAVMKGGAAESVAAAKSASQPEAVGLAEAATPETSALGPAQAPVPAPPVPRAGPWISAEQPRVDGRPVAYVNGKPVPADGYTGGYHGASDYTVEQVLTEGLPARGQSWDLVAHAEQAGDSAFRGTTPMVATPDGSAGAAVWAGEGGIVIEVEGVPGWDINGQLQGRVQTPGGFRGNLMTGEVELAVPARVPVECIKRVGRVSETRGGRLLVRQEDWVANPRFKGRK